MPPIITPSATTNGPGGGTRAQYRWRLSRELGYFVRRPVTSLATGLEKERYVVSSALRSDPSKGNRFDDLYLYVPTNEDEDRQREIWPGTFDGPNGALMVDYPFASALPIGTYFECSVMPAEEYLGMPGTNDCLNMGLDTLPCIDLLSFDAISDTLEYSMAGYTWPVKSVKRVFRPRSVTTPEREHQIELSGWKFWNDAEAPLLVLPYSFNTGDTFMVEVTRPASTRIRSLGVAWGDTAVGLENDSDEALYSITDVVRAALPFAKERMAQLYDRGSTERGELLGEAQDAEMKAGISKFLGSFRGDGIQRVGARSSTRSWWWTR